MVIEITKDKTRLLLVLLILIVVDIAFWGTNDCYDNKNEISVAQIETKAFDNTKNEAQAKEDVQESNFITEEPKSVYIGNFTATAYCICYDCCQKTPEDPAYGITASGKRATPGITVAMDKSMPFGTKVYIDGVGERIVQDRGSAIKGNRVDILFSSHEEAKQFGVQQKEVFIRKD